MKQNNQKLNAGVWLDNSNAMIISNISSTDNEYSILDKVKAKSNHGGGSEHSMNNAKQTDAVKYFKSISTHLLKYESILLFGPGQSQEQFQHHLQEDVQFKNKKISIESAEKLTDPQMIAKVRDFFEAK